MPNPLRFSRLDSTQNSLLSPAADFYPSLLGLALAFFLLALSGCATSGPQQGGSQGDRAVEEGSAKRGSNKPGSAIRRWLGPIEEGEKAWLLPEGLFPSQRLYRVSYQGPEGKLGFRLTLYLADRQHYRMDAADTLGRRVWSLGVEPGDRAVWIDHRQKTYCLTRGASQQTFVPIAHLPLEALPRLILGRMPARPVGEVEEGNDKIVYRDSRGQEWNGKLEEGTLAWWSLIQGGEAVAWWRLHGKENIFSDRRGGQQVRWTEQVRELLERPLPALGIPESYREGVCGNELTTVGTPR